ncbi:MAG: hypothetical protein ABIK28_16060 [Planctomycetota bacterium]
MPFLQTALQYYAAYKNGITPNGRGLKHETALYQTVMVALAALEDESFDWYQKEKAAK